MKKIFSYTIALLPILLLISLLLLVPIILLIFFIPSNYLFIRPMWIIEIYIGILLLGYGIRLNIISISLKAKIFYLIVSILVTSLSLILLFYFKNLLFIFYQLFLPILYVLIFEQRLVGFKTYLQRSRDTLVGFNIFDAFFVVSYFCLRSILRNNVNRIEVFLNELPISHIAIEGIFLILFIFVLFILIPALRGFLGVWFYRKQNGICKQSGKVFWNSNIAAYVVSVISIILYISTFFQISSLDDSTLLVYLILMSFTVYFWTIVCEGIDKGGEDKERVLSNWVLIGLISIFLILLDMIESDLIGILTWFLPMLLPVFVGKVNNIVPRGNLKSHTPAMKKHLYWLQIMSFNTLFVFNILSSISTKQAIKKEQIEQINVFKDSIISVLDRGTSSKLLLGILVSFIMLLISIAIAYILSKLMIYLIRRFYIDASNKYFK